ncbi:MAG: class I tRNA ligase family protein, partial [Nanoarchaeota archaeon]
VLEEERPKFISDFKKVGLSCDWDIKYTTIDQHSQKISQDTFLDLVKKKRISRKEGPVMWDRVFQTPIAQAELEDKEQKSHLNYVKAKLLGSDKTYLIFATTRPELLFACAGFSVQDIGNYVKLKVGDEYYIFSETTYKEKLNQFNINYEVVEHLKGKNLIGEKVVIPFTNSQITITHDTAVNASFGTGIAYFCSYGGLDDIEYFARNKLSPIEILEKNGKLNSKCQKYEGMLAIDARKQIIDDLNKEKHLLYSEPIINIVNIGERSGVEVEYIVTKQWYVDYLDKKEYFFEKAQEFNWYPIFMKHRLENWIKGLNWNWGFSRQRHYGIPIPAWHCKDCSNIIYAQKDETPIDPIQNTNNKKCDKCGSKNIIGETDIMDTWFTSASSPFLVIEKLKNEKMKKKLFPMDLRPQAHDIINFWLFYTMAKNTLLHNKIPFKNVAISGFVLDPKGQKMSKSKGNTIKPQDIVNKYSNDSLRFAASSTKLGNDMPFQEKEVLSGIKLVNKLYNANKFASMLLDDFSKKDIIIKYEDLLSVDKWILAKCQYVIKKSTESFENYDYQSAKKLWYDFFMHDVANNYIEIVKTRLWQKTNHYKSAQSTLYYILYNSLKGLAPIIPFITEDIYQIYYRDYEGGLSIHQSKYPELNEKFKDENLINIGEKYIDILDTIRKYKAENKLNMRTQLSKLNVLCKNKDIKNFVLNSIDDLKAVNSIKEIIININKDIDKSIDIEVIK